MKIDESPKNTLYKRIGCYGCLVYLLLFGTLAITVTALGFDTLWAVVILAIFVIIWFLAMYWALQKDKYKD